MPNYIKNRIEIIGTQKQVDDVIKRFTTSYPEEQKESFDGKKTFKNASNEYGWLDTITKKFSRRNCEDVNGIPKNFYPHMAPAWDRFPDFERIIKMPDSLHITSDSWVMPLENKFSGHTKFREHLDDLRDFCLKQPKRKKKTIENFIAGVRNHIEHGHATWYRWSVENWGTKWNSSECEKISMSIFDFITAWSGVPNLVELMSKEFPKITFKYEYSDEDTGCNCGIGAYLNGEIEFRKLENSSKEAYDLAFKLRPEYADNYELVDGKYEYVEED